MDDTGILRLAQPGDQDLIDDLARAGIIVETIHRTTMYAGARLIIVAHGARLQPLVAIVSRGPNEHNEAYARLMTKGLGHAG